MSNKEQQIPAIRFKGFTDVWEQRKLKELTEVITKGTTPKDKSGKGSINFVKVENINKSSGEIDIKSKITENEHEGYLKRSQLKDGDILFSIAGTLGRTAIVKKELLPANTNQALAIIRLDEGDKNYITTFLNGRAAEDFIKKNPTVGAQPNLSLEQVGNLLIEIPSLEEQTKIGSFFKQLDDTIALHQRQMDNYTELKKGMLQKIFSQDGEKDPEIRFEGFSEEWQQRKLIEIADYRNGKAHEQHISENGLFVVINSKFVSTNGKVRKYSDKQIEPMRSNEIAFVLSDVPNGRAIARTYLVDENGKYTLNQRIAGITPHSNTNTYFLHQLMNRHNYFLRFDDGVKQTNLSKENIENFTESYPSHEEQIKVGNFFKNLDNTIALHQQKISNYKTLKSSLLNKMFV